MDMSSNAQTLEREAQTPKQGKFVAYYRVSTDRQGKSGLGLEAQRQAVMDYLNGGGWELVAEFTETESGKHNDRPELARAIQQAKITGSTLLVAKLDRLSRNAAFLMTLRDSGVDFVACDVPEANKMTIGVLAVMAEYEREQISARTKAALQAAKARGVKLGNPNGAAPLRRAAKGNVDAVATIKDKAQQFAEDLRPTIEDIQAAGHTTLRAIASELNKRGIKTARGGTWQANTVRNVLKRL